MATSSYNSLLLLFSSTLLISVAVLCHGIPVLDTDGNEVELSSAGSYSYYRIQNAGPIGFHGELAPFPKSICTNYVFEAPVANPGVPVTISGSISNPVVQIGLRYTFSFSMLVPLLCETAWTIGDVENNGDTSFLPIIAGDVFPSNRKSWFEVRLTEKEGVYELAACGCELCRNICPKVGSNVVNGTSLLGVGGNPYTVRFVKSAGPIAMKTAQL